LANTGITINGTTIALGASGTIVAGTDWQSVITAAGGSNTASAGEGYFIDTTSNTHTINLPSSPSQGDEVTIVDYAGTFGTNNVTVGRNGSNIDNTAYDATLSTNRLNVRFVYIDATQGWRAVFDDASASYGVTYITATGGTVTTSGNFKIHTFTGDGCFVVSQTAVGAPNVVDYLVVAGGGSGPSTNGGDGISGGGGAGGFRFYANPTCNPQSGPGAPLNAPAGITVTATTYPISVGGGGSAGTGPSGWTSGSNSSFSTITSTGGGRGGRGDPNGNGQPGGSGGGGDNGSTAGSGNTPPTSPSQGNNGGNSGCSSGGGGGGAIAVGAASSPVPANAGNGGAGAGITGFGAGNGECSASVQYFAGGGGGGNGNANAPTGRTAGTGGLGGGGNGITPASGAGPGNPGTANTGGGGGGVSDYNPGGALGGNGGKGIVVIRYKYQ